MLHVQNSSDAHEDEMKGATSFDWTAFNQLVSSHFVAATPTTMSLTYGRPPDSKQQLMQDAQVQDQAQDTFSMNRAVDIIAKMPQDVLKSLVSPIQHGFLDLETIFYLKNDDGTEHIAISAEDFLQLVEAHFTGKKDNVVSDEAFINWSDLITVPAPLLDAWNRALEKHKNSSSGSSSGYASMLASLQDQEELNKKVMIDINQHQSTGQPHNSSMSTIFDPTNASEYAYDKLDSQQIVHHKNILRYCGLKLKIASLLFIVLLLLGVFLALGLFFALWQPSNVHQTITTTTITPSTTPRNAAQITDCYDWHHKLGYYKSGIYTVYPNGTVPFDVYCDMVTDGGGWTVFQMRTDDSLVFWNRNWTEYKYGFDNGLNRNFWLGNDNIHMLSSKDPNVTLRIDIWGDRAPGSSNANGYWFSEYTSFSVENETAHYILHVGPTTAGNLSTMSGQTDGGFFNNYNQPFSTFDTIHVHGNLCPERQGGWWVESGCSDVALNGKYVPPTWSYYSGYVWHNDELGFINPARSEMKLRKILDIG